MKLGARSEGKGVRFKKLPVERSALGLVLGLWIGLELGVGLG